MASIENICSFEACNCNCFWSLLLDNGNAWEVDVDDGDVNDDDVSFACKSSK